MRIKSMILYFSRHIALKYPALATDNEVMDVLN